MTNPYQPTPDHPAYEKCSIWKKLYWDATHYNFLYIPMEQLMILGQFEEMERIYNNE